MTVQLLFPADWMCSCSNKQFEYPSHSIEIIKVLCNTPEGQGVMNVQISAGPVYNEDLERCWHKLFSMFFILAKSCVLHECLNTSFDSCGWEHSCVVLIGLARDVVG